MTAEDQTDGTRPIASCEPGAEARCYRHDVSMTEGSSHTRDPISTRLGLFLDDLRSELGDAASIVVEARDGWRTFDLRPTREGALDVFWTDFYLLGDGSPGDALQVEAGHQGGRWELGRDQDDLLLLIDLVRSVVAGRVIEVFGPARSRVEVTLSDGTRKVEIGARAPVGCLPVPGWMRFGRRVKYAPYR
ncbi:hypothetical protein ACQPXM_12775 [Kribbella sp. CA-253562]|uniref:hypothetical protein n=1 Tax=Kribbella sp. CA-253562 TaxID=3239942 RepID=UPI003D9341AD